MGAVEYFFTILAKVLLGSVKEYFEEKAAVAKLKKRVNIKVKEIKSGTNRKERIKAMHDLFND